MSSAHKQFIPLENNPTVMTPLAHALGLSPSFAFHDLYSFTDPDLLALVPRPAHALLAIIPSTEKWIKFRSEEDAAAELYGGTGPEEPTLWFRQTIGNACGLIGLLHCALNPPDLTASNGESIIVPNSPLSKLVNEATPLGPAERARLLEISDLLEAAHEEAAHRGDTAAPPREIEPGYHFVAFVKGKDGHLYEMEGDRKGPVDRGLLGKDEDVLSKKALELGIGLVLKLESDVRFSCTVLGPSDY